MSIVTYEDLARKIRTHYDDEAPSPRRIEVWLSGSRHVMVADAHESGHRVWGRIVQHIGDSRTYFLKCDRLDPYATTGRYTPGDAYGWADVYAGIGPTLEQKEAHFKQAYIWALWRRARPEHNKSAIGRVKALVELSEVLGLVTD